MDEDKKDLVEIQHTYGYTLKKILEENSDLNKNEIQNISDNISLDVQLLYEKCNDLYKSGDTKKDMFNKLLTNIKNSENKFFSKIAEEMLNEGWCDKIDDSKLDSK